MSGLDQEATIRLACFAGVLLVMAVWEIAAPRRALLMDKPRRWFTNLAIVVADSLALRLLFPFLAVAMAQIAADRGWGLFALTDLPFWLEVALAVVLLDLAIYGQHVASHKIPILWRVHQMHHADRDFDVTTALRFHPIEIVLSMLYKFAVIIVLGPPALGVLIFEVLLNGTAMFNHSNVRIPKPLDRLIRSVVVTPDMHRVHHSVIRREHHTNYGFSLSVWDRLFGTYTDQPKGGHEGMTIGLEPYQTDDPTRLGWCLALPFFRRSGGTALSDSGDGDRKEA